MYLPRLQPPRVPRLQPPRALGFESRPRRIPGVIRGLVLGVAGRPAIRKAVTGGIGRRVALRFVAGETLSAAIEVTRRLNGEGFAVSLDHLGENVTDPVQAASAAAVYGDAVTAIHIGGMDADVSMKLTQLGLDLDPALAYEHARGVVARADAAGTSVTLDMEDHRYTDSTIDACLRLSGSHQSAIGVAIQAGLKRSPADLERLIAAGVQVRLCKGAYKETRARAYQRRARVSSAFADLATRLLDSRAYPMIATHDEELVRHAIAEVARRQRPRSTFEFQFLYGVRRELQQRLRDEGYRVRIYVPFGDQWYPYLTRRIAERPANLRFFAESLLRK
jgi:proline dehydrogenase